MAPDRLDESRMEVLARSALDEVAQALTANAPWEPAELPVLVGLPEVCPGFTEAQAQALCIRLSSPAYGIRWLATPLPGGHAAALDALRQATEKVRRGEWPLCVVGGADSYLHAERLGALERSRQLLVDDGRAGFIPGEAAGFVALARADVAKRLKLPSLAVVCGAHATNEPKRIKTETINLGEGLAAAIQGAMVGLRLPDEAIDTVYCDLNGERFRSEEWGFAVLRLPMSFRDPAAYVSPVSAWGDIGAASGALLAILAVQSWKRGYARGPRALLWASSEGGLRAAVSLERAAS
jgi:3-oxoacyl-[acyl-carrier-protein] synthase-1